MSEMNLDAIYVNPAENPLYMSGFDNPDGHLVIQALTHLHQHAKKRPERAFSRVIYQFSFLL